MYSCEQKLYSLTPFKTRFSKNCFSLFAVSVGFCFFFRSCAIRGRSSEDHKLSGKIGQRGRRSSGRIFWNNFLFQIFSAYREFRRVPALARELGNSMHSFAYSNERSL